VPHIPLLVPGRQTPFVAQQPFGHEVPSQTHAPLTQCLPAAQGAALPHRQAPVAAHVLAPTGSHGTQVPPPVPQAAIEGVVHAPFAQQPLGQLSTVHTQAPFRHSLPAAHCPDVAPQRQSPVAGSQWSARMGSHATQPAPPVPQVAATG